MLTKEELSIMVEWLATHFVFMENLIWFSAWRLAILTEVFLIILQFLQENPGIVP
jgi:hypothetical protein